MISKQWILSFIQMPKIEIWESGLLKNSFIIWFKSSMLIDMFFIFPKITDQIFLIIKNSAYILSPLWIFAISINSITSVQLPYLVSNSIYMLSYYILVKNFHISLFSYTNTVHLNFWDDRNVLYMCCLLW